MTAVGQRLKVRLFLEGVECPVVSASIQSQKNAPAVASIQIPASDYAMELLPRTLVHLFVYDAYRGAPPADQVYVAGQGIDVKQQLVQDPEAGSRIPTTQAAPDRNIVDLENENYKLIFGGEVMGIQYSKTPMSRGIVLQCSDWSSYWDIALQYQIGGFSLGGGGIKAAFTGASTTVFNEMLEGSGDIVMKLLELEPRGHPTLKGTLLGGLINLIEAMGGIYFGDRAIRGTNDFFSLAEMRLHLTQMIGANPYKEQDELKLLRANGFGGLFRKTLGGLGKLVSIRQVLLALQRYIFHEIIPITAPRYRPSEGPAGAPQFEVVPLTSRPDTAPLVKAAMSLKSRVLALQSRQQSVTVANVAEVSASAGGLQFELLDMSGIASKQQQLSKSVRIKTGTSAVVGQDFVGLQEVESIFELVARQILNLLGQLRIGASNTFELPVAGTQAAKLIETNLSEIAAALQRVLDAKVARKVGRAVTQPKNPARLFSQVYRPDVWMVAPPRCNVIFPELYSQFNYGRQFNAEVTRLLLRTHEAFFGSDIIFDGFYMAPSRALGVRSNSKIGKGRVGATNPDLSDAPAWVVKDLMEHELYTGILPAFERMSDLNLHAIKGGHIEIKGLGHVSYAQLACNHIFFQYRFKSRELSVQGRFNPYLVLGFPSVVIDKYLSVDRLKDAGYDTAVAARLSEAFKTGDTLPVGESATVREVSAAQANEAVADLLQPRSNTHYLGTPEVVMHQLSASSGGTTQIQMAYARTTNERMEFLGDNVGVSAKAKFTQNVLVPTVVAAFGPPPIGYTGYVGGKIKSVKDVTDQYKKKLPKGRGANDTSRFSSDALLPLWLEAASSAGRVRRGTRVPVGITQAAILYGNDVVGLTGSDDPAVEVTFRAFRIVEEIGAYEKQAVDIPPEDMLFPPWYGEAYRTNKIGGIYSYLFGVGAITDPTVILGGTAPRSFGDGDTNRTLWLQFEKSMLSSTNANEAVAGDNQLPVPGLSSNPDLPGGGQAGPAKEASSTDAVLGDIKTRSTLTLALEELVAAYSATRTQNYDTPNFVQNYTWRPIASMVDMFGTSELEIDDTGVVTAGREGFHSRAFGDIDDLRQLVNQSEGRVPMILGLAAKPQEIGPDDKEAETAQIAARLDTRKEKRLAVMRYLHALAASRGVVLG